MHLNENASMPTHLFNYHNFCRFSLMQPIIVFWLGVRDRNFIVFLWLFIEFDMSFSEHCSEDLNAYISLWTLKLCWHINYPVSFGHYYAWSHMNQLQCITVLTKHYCLYSGLSNNSTSWVCGSAVPKAANCLASMLPNKQYLCRVERFAPLFQVMRIIGY
jgi:hypothetical protein